MNNWIINAMPTLISVIQHLTDKGIKIISVDTNSNETFRIHCSTNDEFKIWAEIRNAEVDDHWNTNSEDNRYPYQITVWMDSIMVFGLMGEEEYREWRGE